MATAVKTRRKGKTVDLREEMDLRPIDGQSVDRANSIIRGVKVLSRFSPNKHGMMGVDGTSYEPSAHHQLKDLLESGSVNVNMGHPPKDKPDLERAYAERNGVLLNPRVINGETFADWHLIPSHVMTPSLLDCAEKKELNGQFALSINARGYGDVKNGRYCITEFLPTPSNPETCIRSVDCVTRGGACRTLYESSEVPMKIKFKDVVAKSSKGVQEWWKRCEKRAKAANLMEMYEDMAELPVDAPADDPATAIDESNGETWKEHLGNLLKAIVNDPEMDMDQIRKKVTAAIKCLEEEEAVEGDEAVEELAEGDEDEEKEKEAMESRQIRKERDELKDREGVRELAESLEYPAITQAEVVTVSKLKGIVDRVKKIGELRKSKTKQGGPRTASGRNLIESQEVKKTVDYSNQTAEARRQRIASIK